MSFVSASEDFLAVSTCSRSQLFDLKSCSPHQRVPPATAEGPSRGADKCESGAIPIACSAFSPSGDLFAFGEGKTLHVLRVGPACSPPFKKPLSRSASRLRFTPKGEHVIVADKAGDVYRFSVNDDSAQGELLLGHLSLLLDVLVTHDEKFIITCDRDEKIRVSCYPNAYNIHGYCLGHREFVSSVEVFPCSPGLLVSGSGDGTLRLWDYGKCEELFCYDMGKDAGGNAEHPPAVSGLRVHTPSGKPPVVVVRNSSYSGFIVFSVLSTSPYSLSLTRKVDLCSPPLGIALNKAGLLFVLPQAQKGIYVYKVDCANCEFVLDREKSSKLGDAISECNILSGEQSLKNYTYQLYKRTFNEVQEYYKRKKERMTELEMKKQKVKNDCLAEKGS